MSAGYADRLSPYPNKGVCGLPESVDSKRVFWTKMDKLASLVQGANHLVILTGAGVSTSAGIPDFRGPKGVWTVEQRKRQGKKKQDKLAKKAKKDDAVENPSLPERGSEDGSKGCHEGTPSSDPSPRAKADERSSPVEVPPSTASQEREMNVGSGVSPQLVIHPVSNHPTSSSKRKRDDGAAETNTGGGLSFEIARPTLTHRAITKLASLGILKHCITQNVDGLHRRSGLPRTKHSVLHGCVFTEKCEKCGAEHFRDFDVQGLSFQKTGRMCTVTPGCDGDLRDTILDWEDALPEEDWERAQAECEKSDLVVCLGTSLRIEPAGSLPLRATKFAIVNLQVTPYDKDAHLLIRAKVDEVMSGLMDRLDLPNWDEEKSADA